MEKALKKLQSKLKGEKTESIRIDGNDRFVFEKIKIIPSFHIRGDSQFSEIQAASILAKVYRDAYLSGALEKKYPHYGFAKHKGYGTALHAGQLQKYGACPEHRFSFRPIKTLENADKMNNMKKV